MFSKKPAETQESAPPLNPPTTPKKPSFGNANKSQEKPMASANASTFSVIGTDVTIKGDVSASIDLHVDGTIEGDIKCASLVQGEGSTITGGVMAETARMSGKVVGSINARELVILKSARIEGDVHYDALTIEQGAQVDGRFAPNAQRKASGSTSSASKGVSTGSTGSSGKGPESDPQLQIAS